jgi:hypothetical protein
MLVPDRTTGRASLPPPVATAAPCPLCGLPLQRDQWCAPRWTCAAGHGYSNVRVLIAELEEKGSWPG